jgi:glutaminyl-peptide cyclotransferase
VRFHRLRVLRRMPHPGRGFTQGLIVDGGTVWESTGEYGESALCRYQLGADRVAERAPLPPELFAEGICLAGGHIWQLTWQERVALRWHPQRLGEPETVPYNREGWGMCSAEGEILTSDGSSELVRRDPGTLKPLGIVLVRLGGDRAWGLNDLAWAAGRVWANVLGSPCLLGIEPASGEVADIVDARAVMEHHRGDPQAVLNGIAPLPAAGEFLLTGKRWRSVYHVRLTEDRRRRHPGRLLAE